MPMYESFYGFKEKPFNLNPDPDYLFMSQTHENAHTHLEYAVAENKGFVVITGEIGAGKTTLINYLLKKIQQEIHVGVINNTSITQSSKIFVTPLGITNQVISVVDTIPGEGFVVGITTPTSTPIEFNWWIIN